MQVYIKSHWLRGAARAFLAAGLATPVLWIHLRRHPATWLAITVAAYLYLRRVGSSKPLLPSELAIVLSEIDSTMQAAVLGALVTATGFVIAFSVAHSAWKTQRQAELRLAAGDEIFSAFHRAIEDAKPILNYARQLQDVRKQIDGDAEPDLIRWGAKRIAELNSSYREAQRKTSENRSSIFDVKSKHHLVLDGTPFGLSMFEKAQKHLNAALEHRFFVAPSSSDDSEYVERFLRVTSDPQWREFETAYDANDSSCLAVAAGIRGGYLATVLKPSLWSAVGALRTARNLFPDRP